MATENKALSRSMIPFAHSIRCIKLFIYGLHFDMFVIDKFVKFV